MENILIEIYEKEMVIQQLLHNRKLAIFLPLRQHFLRNRKLAVSICYVTRKLAVS